MATIQQRDKFVIALDQGTTSSRAVLINHEGCVVDFVQRPFQQIYPHPGWVEHNPQDILFSQIGAEKQLWSGILQPALPFATLSCGSVAELPNL